MPSSEPALHPPEGLASEASSGCTIPTTALKVGGPTLGRVPSSERAHAPESRSHSHETHHGRAAHAAQHL
eukprot:CAMPEP_0185315094 /NCGR_PEP_ID=MMETSP1363-20130426/40595_1 /TAXON_ID=38817 /ORGANISM="Gephyrocapsa oceanica, Strain RCC1303" /LENGTH=69 /DNA_ID=CAMNT_0027913183 /DNA_START=81 /DNA_END=288 /DNA_ORIENTATION=+